MQRTGGDAIQVWQVASADCAQPIEIEMGVAHFEGIEGPFNQPNIATERFVTLKELQHAANAAVAIIGVDSGHMGVKIRRAVAQRRHSQRVSDEIAVVIGTEHLATSVRRNDEHGRGLNFEVLFAPYVALKS